MFDDSIAGGAPAKYVRPNCSAAWWQSVAIVVWRQETLAQDVRAVSAMLESAQMPQGIGLLQIVEASCTSLSPEARTALSELLMRGRTYIRCSAVVFCGNGFKAAAVRAIATGLSMLVRRGFPHEVFADIDEACGRLVSFIPAQGGQELRTMELQGAVGRVRRAGTEGPARFGDQDKSAPLRSQIG